MEADLQRFYVVDYRDRWRFDSEGRRKLTLRRIWWLIKAMPADQSQLHWAAFNDGQPSWSIEAHLVDDVRITLASSEKKPAKPHPARFNKKRVRSGWGDPARVRKLMDAKRRLNARRRALAKEA